jgi:hypothetical protein
MTAITLGWSAGIGGSTSPSIYDDPESGTQSSSSDNDSPSDMSPGTSSNASSSSFSSWLSDWESGEDVEPERGDGDLISGTGEPIRDEDCRTTDLIHGEMVVFLGAARLIRDYTGADGSIGYVSRAIVEEYVKSVDEYVKTLSGDCDLARDMALNLKKIPNGILNSKEGVAVLLVCIDCLFNGKLAENRIKSDPGRTKSDTEKNDTGGTIAGFVYNQLTAAGREAYENPNAFRAHLGAAIGKLEAEIAASGANPTGKAAHGTGVANGKRNGVKDKCVTPRNGEEENDGDGENPNPCGARSGDNSPPSNNSLSSSSSSPFSSPSSSSSSDFDSPLSDWFRQRQHIPFEQVVEQFL